MRQPIACANADIAPPTSPPAPAMTHTFLIGSSFAPVPPRNPGHRTTYPGHVITVFPGSYTLTGLRKLRAVGTWVGLCRVGADFILRRLRDAGLDGRVPVASVPTPEVGTLPIAAGDRPPASSRAASTLERADVLRIELP